MVHEVFGVFLGTIIIQAIDFVEAGTGIEPVYTDLQWNVRV